MRMEDSDEPEEEEAAPKAKETVSDNEDSS